MIGILKKLGIKKAIITALIAWAAAALLLVVSGFALVKIIKGPVELADLKKEDLKGQYVKTKIEMTLDGYVEHYSKSKSGSESLTSKSYIIPVESGILIGAEFNEKADMDLVDRITEETYKVLIGESESSTLSIEVVGTLAKMEKKELQYFKESLIEIGYTEEDMKDVYEPYVLKKGYIGEYYSYIAWIFSAIVIAGILFGIFVLIRAFSGSYQREIRNYVKQNPSVTMDHLEEDFAGATHIGRTVWVGRRFTYYLSGASARILENSTIVWAYFFKETRTNRPVVYSTMVYDKDKESRKIVVDSEGESNAILNIYSGTVEQAIIGYSEDLENCFKNDFERFLQMAHEKVNVDAAASDMDL